jgi:chorismate synthase
MAGNSFGKLFKITTYGESHGKGIGVVIDGCPAGLELDLEVIQLDLSRRRPGQSKIVTQRKEADEFDLISGVYEGKTTGTPIHLFIPNTNAKSKDYSEWENTFRPSHADYTYYAKYGHRDHRGGGRSSARETAARVAAGAIAKQLLQHFGIKVAAYVSQVGHLKLEQSYQELDLSLTENNPVRCPNPQMAEAMEELIRQVRKEGDTIGGVITAIISGCPAGLGEPVFDRLHAELGKAILSINACKGFEYGSGFDGVEMRGSQHNDIFIEKGGEILTETNFSGGIQGGISNGMDIYFRAAFKPVATIMHAQATVTKDGQATELTGKGRHDPCVLPRAVPIVEAMAALVMADYLLLHQSSQLNQL